MARGIIRRIDHLGRITLPMEYRRILDIEEGQAMDLYLDGGSIRLNKGKGRNLDELGRYTLPIEIRRSLRFEDRQKVDLYIEDGAICIRKDGCEWCDSTEDLFEINGHHLCRKCAYAVVDAVMED